MSKFEYCGYSLKFSIHAQRRCKAFPVVDISGNPSSRISCRVIVNVCYEGSMALFRHEIKQLVASTSMNMSNTSGVLVLALLLVISEGFICKGGCLKERREKGLVWVAIEDVPWQWPMPSSCSEFCVKALGTSSRVFRRLLWFDDYEKNFHLSCQK